MLPSTYQIFGDLLNYKCLFNIFKLIVQCVQCYCHQMSLCCCESVIFCNLSGWLMYSVRWWGRRRCNFVCGRKGIAAKMHSTPRPRVSCNWLSSVRLRWMICTLLPYWCILIWMICTLLMHFLGGFRNCVTHAGRVWPSRQASHQVGRSTWTREVSYPTMANANLRIAQQCKGLKALVKPLFFYVNVSSQSLIFIQKTNMLNSIFRYF